MWYGLSQVPGFLSIVSSSDSGSRDPSVIILFVGAFRETYSRVVDLKGLNSQVRRLLSNLTKSSES